MEELLEKVEEIVEETAEKPVEQPQLPVAEPPAPTTAALEQELEELQSEPISKGEIGAMILSAFLTIFPVCVGVILFICLIVALFFLR